MHDKQGKGEAFVIPPVLPVNKWIYISLAVGDGSADIYVDDFFTSYKYHYRYYYI